MDLAKLFYALLSFIAGFLYPGWIQGSGVLLYNSSTVLNYTNSSLVPLSLLNRRSRLLALITSGRHPVEMADARPFSETNKVPKYQVPSSDEGFEHTEDNEEPIGHYTGEKHEMSDSFLEDHEKKTLQDQEANLKTGSQYQSSRDEYLNEIKN